MPGFDDSWAEGVSARGWPSALARAVRADPRALATQRAVASLRAWRRAPSGSQERGWLEAVAEALVALPGRSRPESPVALPGRSRPESPVDPRPSPDEPRPVDEPPTAPLLLPPPTAALPRSSESTETLVPAFRDPSPGRPPASGLRVRALAQRLGPLADEILPLPVARRAPRFWARWREVGGDGGIPREAIEALLEHADTRPLLLGGIIAEVLEADLNSVLEFLEPLD